MTEHDIRDHLDALAKPRGSLGRLEDLAVRLALTQGRLDPVTRPRRVVLFAGDHGCVADGVSAWPSAVTGMMVATILGGRATSNALACWYNTIIAARSNDGGVHFAPASPLVVAAAPFRQDVDQTRHRGFFNPSNIVSDGHFTYFMASTTGWSASASGLAPEAEQEAGVCLFRSATPADPLSWRAWDGRGYTVAYADPYAGKPRPAPCAVIAPFPAPVGSIVRVEPGGLWLAAFQAKADSGVFPVPGFYTATSRDLLHWSAPRLLLPGPTLYDDACHAGGPLIAYPVILDPASPSRNFDRTGATADL